MIYLLKEIHTTRQSGRQKMESETQTVFVYFRVERKDQYLSNSAIDDLQMRELNSQLFHLCKHSRAVTVVHKLG